MAAQRTFRLNAAAGAAVWLVAALWLRPGPAVLLLWLGPLIVVPLGLEILAAETAGWRTLALAQPVAAGLLVVSYASPIGLYAAAGTLPWLVFTIAVAIIGLRHGFAHRWRPTAELSIAAGMIYLPVGAGWALLSRYGARPLDFGEMIVLLTAVHFHFAGFALPLLTGLATRRVDDRLARLAAWGVVLGVPLVAVGITAGSQMPIVELGAAWFLTAATLATVVTQSRAALRQRGFARLLLLTSSLALVGGMALAATYALGVYSKTYWLSVETMIVTHGLVNAVGFALAGLLAWNLAGPESGAGASPG